MNQESYLPETLRTAMVFKGQLLPELEAIDGRWPYGDRVLVWLMPALARDVRQFHEAGGPEIGALFARHQLDSIDRDASRLLRQRIRELLRNQR